MHDVELSAATFTLTQPLPEEPRLIAAVVERLVQIGPFTADTGCLTIYLFSAANAFRWELRGDAPCDRDDLVRALVALCRADAVALVTPLGERAVLHLCVESSLGGLERLLDPGDANATHHERTAAQPRWIGVAPETPIKLQLEPDEDLHWGPAAEA